MCHVSSFGYSRCRRKWTVSWAPPQGEQLSPADGRDRRERRPHCGRHAAPGRGLRAHQSGRQSGRQAGGHQADQGRDRGQRLQSPADAQSKSAPRGVVVPLPSPSPSPSGLLCPRSKWRTPRSPSSRVRSSRRSRRPSTSWT